MAAQIAYVTDAEGNMDWFRAYVGLSKFVSYADEASRRLVPSAPALFPTLCPPPLHAHTDAQTTHGTHHAAPIRQAIRTSQMPPSTSLLPHAPKQASTHAFTHARARWPSYTRWFNSSPNKPPPLCPQAYATFPLPYTRPMHNATMNASDQTVTRRCHCLAWNLFTSLLFQEILWCCIMRPAIAAWWCHIDLPLS